MLPDHYTLGQFAAPAWLERQHGVLGMSEDRGMALPLLLIQEPVLVQVHSEKPLQHLPVIDLVFGKLAVFVFVPFAERCDPGQKSDALSGITPWRPRGHVDHRAGGHRSGN